MEVDTVNRYQSRILREMRANRENPFNSPPSSTGSHGTVTMSSILSDPDGESTRRLKDDIVRVSLPNKKVAVNWEAAHRRWPQYYSMPKSTTTKPASPEPISDDDTFEQRLHIESKENRPPSLVKMFTDDDDDDSFIKEPWTGSKRTRSQMQPRADNESDLSLLLKSPISRLSKLSISKRQTRRASPSQKFSSTKTPSKTSPGNERRPSITEALQRLQRANGTSPKFGSKSQMSGANASPDMSSARSSMTAVHQSPRSDDNHNDTLNIPSFFMPDVSHLGDFVTGTLRFSGSTKNGVPILVKHGKVVDQHENPSAARHGAVDAVQIPEEEEKIFVSMDMIRDEIVSLQEHHDKVQQYAINMQNKVQSLEAQLSGRGHSKGNFADRGFDDDRAQLELENASLQSRLEQATQKLSIRDIEKDTLAIERDRVINRLQEACDDINKLTRKLSHKDKDLETSQQLRLDMESLQQELNNMKNSRDGLQRENSLLRGNKDDAGTELRLIRQEIDDHRAESARLRQEQQVLLTDNSTLRSSNSAVSNENAKLRRNLDDAQHEIDALREEIELLRSDQDTTDVRQDNASLVRSNERYFTENKKLKKEIDLLRSQLDNGRRQGKEGAASTTNMGEKTADNMTSAFLIPDITMKSNDSAPFQNTETEEYVPPTTEMTLQSQDAQSYSEIDTQIIRRDGGAHKVAFALPEKARKQQQQQPKPNTTRGSKRSQSRGSKVSYDQYTDYEETTGPMSVDRATDDRAMELSIPIRTFHGVVPGQNEAQSYDDARRAKKAKFAHHNSAERNTTSNTIMTTDTEAECPALSNNAKQVLDDLCEHNCSNCTVCARITSHRSAVSTSDLASGKKRVIVSRPIPVSELQLDGEDHTMRPFQSPGHALALVIKGLEDESRHLQFEISRLQRRYNTTDKSRGRRERLALAERIRTLLKRAEAKDDQIYSLYDVLEGQKAAKQEMTEEEMEITILNITGMTMRDMTGNSDQFTWEGIQEA